MLIVSEEANRHLVKSAVSQWALDTTCCSSVREARAALSQDGFSLIFCEEQFSDGTYQDLLEETGKLPKAHFVVISATPELDEKYDEAMQLGAFDVIASPCRKSDVQWTAIRALQEETRRGGNRRRSKPENVPGGATSEGSDRAGEEAPQGRH